MRAGRVMMALIAACLLAGGCGGSSEGSNDPLEEVPAEDGLRAQLRSAERPAASDFPAVEGRSLQQVADSLTGGPEAALAGSVFTVGENRLPFGVIDPAGSFVYGKSAVYVAPTPDAKARGPYPAPADVLITAARFRSRQAATESDPFAAVYAAEVPFTKAGKWSVLTVTESDGGLVGAPTQVEVKAKARSAVPTVGEPAPEVETDTLASLKGDEELLDTRVPPAPDLHRQSFADVVGEKPVALLFSTPQLCKSRVCGPVTDIALQMQSEYGERMDFIHQEVYVGNDPGRGVREPLREFELRTEPWLFVVDPSGTITARLEGSFGLDAFERAIKSAL